MKIVLYCAVISLIYIVHGKPLSGILTKTQRYGLDKPRVSSRDLDGRSAKRSDSDSSDDSESSEIIKVPTCPVGWSQNGAKCYLLQENKVTWEAARIACQGEMGFLAEVTSLAELNFLYNAFTFDRVWIGIHDKVTDGSFVLDTSGSPVNFTYWDYYEPRASSDFNCVYMYYSPLYEWGTTFCDRSDNVLMFICQRQADIQ